MKADRADVLGAGIAGFLLGAPFGVLASGAPPAKVAAWFISAGLVFLLDRLVFKQLTKRWR